MGKVPTSDTPGVWEEENDFSLCLSLPLALTCTHTILKCKEQGENVYLYHLACFLNSSFQERNMFSLP